AAATTDSRRLTAQSPITGDAMRTAPSLVSPVVNRISILPLGAGGVADRNHLVKPCRAQLKVILLFCNIRCTSVAGPGSCFDPLRSSPRAASATADRAVRAACDRIRARRPNVSLHPDGTRRSVAGSLTG